VADYKVQVGEAGPLMVRAANKAQAIRFACHKIVSIEILTTEDAIRLGKAGQELLDATGELEIDSGSEPDLLDDTGEDQIEVEIEGSDPPAEGTNEMPVEGELVELETGDDGKPRIKRNTKPKQGEE
jgi:hypothetical protein